MGEKGRAKTYVRIPRPKHVAPAGTAQRQLAGRPAPTPGGLTGPAISRSADERARVVIPRQGRGGPAPSGLDIELREVRQGLTSPNPYLRVVTRKRSFTRSDAGTITATRLGSTPRGPIERVVAAIKGVLLGNPFASSRLVEERLSKVKALAIFSSDALSSTAYATEEILLILILAGSGALHNALPIAAVIAALLAIVTLSYRQTIKEYPSGGGAYIVAYENLGRWAGLTAGGALLVDYVLTVSVSVAAGVAAVTSAVPDLDDVRVPIGIVMIVLITLGNLRGIREAGTLFAIPTYFFVFSMATVVAVGFAKVALGDAPGSIGHEADPQEHVVGAQGLTLFLVLRAFSSGSTALTGIEAISNGIPAFKKPEVSNARATMTAMAVILAVLFIGITFLTSRYGFVPEHGGETIVSKLGKEVLGKNFLYYAYQVGTALVLFLAANTSYNGFPPLGAILARDRFLPRQFSFRGDRLAYSHGIVMLALAAIVLLVAFGGEVTRLIPLYALGVFVSFTLSQSGMVVHWWRRREQGWRFALAISLLGAAVTGVVAVIIGGTKFMSGAWISVLMMLALMLMFVLIRRHYDWFEKRLRIDEDAPAGVPGAVSIVRAGEQDQMEYIPPRDHVVVPVNAVNKISLGAVGMAREISRMVTAVHLTDDREAAETLRDRWMAVAPDIPLLIIESPYRSFVGPMLAYVDSLEQGAPERRITVILPTFVPRHWWERILHNRDVLRLRPFLKDRERIRVVDFPYRIYEDDG